MVKGVPRELPVGSVCQTTITTNVTQCGQGYTQVSETQISNTQVRVTLRSVETQVSST